MKRANDFALCQLLTLNKTAMEKYTKKQLKSLVKCGVAIDVTNAVSPNAIPERYSQIGWAEGIYGCTGKLLKGESGQLYAVTDRTTAIYIF